MEWIAKNSELPAAGCAVTNAGALRADYVIHTVGYDIHKGIPQDERKPKELIASLVNVLDTARHMGAQSVAIPQVWSNLYQSYDPAKRNYSQA